MKVTFEFDATTKGFDGSFKSHINEFRKLIHHLLRELDAIEWRAEQSLGDVVESETAKRIENLQYVFGWTDDLLICLQQMLCRWTEMKVMIGAILNKTVEQNNDPN